ncbi:MAG: DUF211 domain-containing protein [Sulfolobales archaeon]
MPIKKIVLDVLKPLKGPSVVEVAQTLSKLEGVSQVVVTVNEIDVETATLTITIEGNSIDYESVRESIEGLGGIIHSIDQVVASSP